MVIQKLNIKHIDMKKLTEISNLIEVIEMMAIEPKPGTTWGDTEHNNPAVSYGYNEALKDVTNMLTRWIGKKDPEDVVTVKAGHELEKVTETKTAQITSTLMLLSRRSHSRPILIENFERDKDGGLISVGVWIHSHDYETLVKIVDITSATICMHLHYGTDSQDRFRASIY